MMEHSSYLVQRLKKPYDNPDPKTILEMMSAYGLAATGLSDEARKILRSVCVFDYMGSAEYEFGSIPRTFREMVKDIQKLTAFGTGVSFKYHNWRTKKNVEGTRTIYIICRFDDIDEIVKRIREMAVGTSQHKERPEVDESLAEYEYSKDTYGWLELDNGYMFFKEERMWKNFCTMFGVKKLPEAICAKCKVEIDKETSEANLGLCNKCHAEEALHPDGNTKK